MTTTGPHEPQITPGQPAPNARLVEMSLDFALGRALDLGCGNGGDALWLAERGWAVTALDVSATAISRLTRLAEYVGLQDRITATSWALNHGVPEGTFDLINAHYLHASHLDRTSVFRTAAHALQPGGHLLIVDHGSIAPWSWDQDPNRHHPTAQEVYADVALDPSRWQALRAEARQRTATGPGGQTATVTDHILMIRRTGNG